jgi:hypothetical protein
LWGAAERHSLLTFCSSCNGNTVVKIIKAGGSSSGMRKCITFYSIRVIEIGAACNSISLHNLHADHEKHLVCAFSSTSTSLGEEITVDYKLKPEPEEQRIPCLCKAENCRLYLN